MNFYSWLFAPHGVVSRRSRLPRGVACDADADKHPKNETLAEHKLHCEAKPDNCPFEKRAAKEAEHEDSISAPSASSAPKTNVNAEQKPSETPKERSDREYREVVTRFTNPDGSMKDGWLKAPNGKDSNLNERQWVQVRTQSFKDWFGDWENDPANASKIVDENGEPKVVYHGARTNDKFTVFKGDEHFFTDNRRIAEMFADENAYRLVVDGKTYAINSREAIDIASAIEPYYPKDILTPWIENCSNILDDISADQLNELIENGSIQSGIDSFDGASEVRIEPAANDIFETFLNIRSPKSLDFEGKTWDVNAEGPLTNAEGKDGVVAKNIVEGGYTAEIDGEEPPPATDYIVFSPNQIKSATDNNGVFSRKSDDINE